MDLQIDSPTDLEILDPDELDKQEQEEKKAETKTEEEDDFPFGW